MPRRKTKLANNEIYHVVLRGIEGMNIFKNDPDYVRVIDNLFEFNDSKRSNWTYRQFHETRIREDDRDLLVEILAFCLMPNHIHLLLMQKQDGGISKFMNKFGTGYATYFNKKYERTGYLFQGRFGAVHIKTDNQLRSVFVYIHTNPAALVDPNWKEGGITKPKEILKYVENYRWSSYPDYLGKDNFPFITQRDLFNKMMGKKDWRNFVNDWVENKTISSFGWDKSIELE